MSKKISTIGYEIPGFSNLGLGFSSKSSLMDSDILLVAPDLPYYENGYYLGKVCYGESGSFKLKEDLAHWKKELVNSLNAGKTVFFMLSEKNDFFVDTGSRSYSGSGRNRNTTIEVTPYSNYELLPAGIGSIHSANGKEILFVGNPLFSNFFKSFKPNLEYKIYLEGIGNATPIFIGKDKTKILGAIYKVGAGQLVVLPYLNYAEDKFTEYKKNKKGKKEEYWTKDAIKFGHMLTDCLIEIDRGLLQDLSKTLPPLWVLHEKYSSKKEVNIQKNINSNVEKIKKIENDNKKLQSELLEEQGLKDLLYEQGKPLENAVIKALEILGFKAENYDDGELELDQIITSPEGYRYIGECEGKNEKDIDITKFRQLLESLNADFDREGVEEKAFGILFGNAQRLTEPQSRILDFTQKCKTGANREKIALVKTADLFNVAQFLKENKNDKFQKECRTAIYNGLGRIVVFPSVPTDSQNIFTNPGDGWEEKKLGDIGKVLMCKRVFKDQTTTAGDIPFYKIGTFGKEPDAYISKEIYDKFRKKFSFPKKGDILISASGTIGRRVKYDGEPAYFQDSNIVWIDNDENKVLNDYLYHFYGACKWSSTKGATISRLYNDNLKQIKIVFPKSLTEQRAIVAKFDALSAETKKLEAVYHQKITDLEELKKSVLHKAFNGELVRVGA